MNKLTGKQGLTHQVAVYVPSTQGLKGEAEPEFMERTIDMVISDLSLWFGGATGYHSTGGYLSDSGELVQEAGVIVRAFAEQLTDDDIDNVVTLAELVKSRHQQECVGLEVDGKLYFI